jgi:hypothetical protein
MMMTSHPAAAVVTTMIAWNITNNNESVKINQATQKEGAIKKKGGMIHSKF